MIASTLSVFVLTGVMTTFLMLGRSGANIANYSMMESHARRALEELSQDLRMASNITFNSSTSITLTVPDNYVSNSYQATYAYDSATQTFYRKPGNASSTAAKTNLINNVTTFAFARYDRVDNAISSTVPGDAAQATALNLSTKRIQLTMVSRTTTKTVAGASNNVLSASYILRNKTTN